MCACLNLRHLCIKSLVSFRKERERGVHETNKHESNLLAFWDHALENMTNMGVTNLAAFIFPYSRFVPLLDV